MTPEEFRQAYFEQYADDGAVCDDAWFENYFDSSSDWLEVEYRAPDEGFVVYSDPESDVGGYWATTSGRTIEGPFQTKAELAVALGYSPHNFPPDSDADDEEDFDDLDEAADEDGDGEDEFDEEFDEAYDEEFDEDGEFDDEDEDDR